MARRGERSPIARSVGDAYDATNAIFMAVQSEIKELSRKKPDTVMNKFKVAQVNRILTDLHQFLKDEPEGKYLDLLDDDMLPQIGDAVVIMAQFDAALKQFWMRHRDVREYGEDHGWLLK
jgi:hypothetical protein